MTINVFINAESEEEANETFQDMVIDFTDDVVEYPSDLIDWEIEEVID